MTPDARKEQTLALLAQHRRATDGGHQHQVLRLEAQIFTLNDGLVHAVANRFASEGKGDYNDLYQIGAIGLTKAIRAFDPAKRNAFSSLAMPYIRGEIMHSRRNRAIKIDRRWEDVFPTLRRLRDAGASLEAIAAALNERPSRGRLWEVGEVQQALAAYKRPDPDSLDKGMGEDGDPWEVADSDRGVCSWDEELAMQVTRRGDGLVDATEICQRHSKRFNDYWHSRRAGRLLEALENSRNQKTRFRPDAELPPLYEIYRGGKQGGGRAWVCDEIAVDLLQWCNPAVAIAVNALVVQRVS